MIAVITPVYNGASSIRRSIDSLKNQTFKDWISIIVNDGSSDETAEILEEYNNSEKFIIINLPENMGRGFARNTALNKAKEINAEYLCMLDADDIYHPQKLHEQFAYMQINSDLALSSSSIGVVNSGGLYRVYEISEKEQRYYFEQYEDLVIVPHASSIIRLNEVNIVFNDSLRYAEDQDFMRRLLVGKNYSFLPKIQYYYNRDDSFSVKKYKSSLSANAESYRGLIQSRSFMLKLHIANSVKLATFILLKALGLEKIYFNRIGRVPTTLEIKRYEKIINAKNEIE